MVLRRRVRPIRTHFYALVQLATLSMVMSLGFVSRVKAEERWGELTMLSPWIEAGATYQEPKTGEFSLSGASFGGRWAGHAHGQLWVEAQMVVGTRSLVLRPTRYAPVSTTERKSDPAIVDAYAGLAGSWGRMRFGFLPVVFGLEEGHENERRWLRPLFLRRGLLGLRDLGVTYSVGAGGFSVDWMGHNGEGGDDRDHETWVTARTEYRMRSDRTAWRAGVSGQVGRTSPDSTHPTGTVATATELDADASSKIRIGGFHTRFDWAIGESAIGSGSDRRFALESEVIGVEVVQENQTRRMRSLRFDTEWEPTEHWGLLARYEALDPDTQAPNDVIQEGSLGVQYYILDGALKRSFRILMVGTAQWLESRHNAEHRFELALRFSPDI